MTVQQLKYIITVAEVGSITEAARQLFISQPSLSGAIKEVENEAKLTIFNRCRAGVALTPEGMEFVGYARQVVQQMELLESRLSTDSRKNSGSVYPHSIIPLQRTPLLTSSCNTGRNAMSLS